MATIFYAADGVFSAATPLTVVASLPDPTGTNSQDALNTARYMAFTPSVGGNCAGAFICTSITSNTAAQSVTVTMQRFVAAVWVDQASKTLTYQDIIGAHQATMTRASLCGTYFIFDTGTYPVTLTTDASTWRIKVESTNGSAYWVKSVSSTSNYAYVIPIATTTSYSSGDNIVLADNVDITIDQSVTAAIVLMGTNSSLVWENPPVASYTLTITTMHRCTSTNFQVGSSASRVPYAQKATISITNNISNKYSALGCYGGNDLFYGAYSDDYYTTLAEDAASGQKIIVTTDDRSATWEAGDTIWVYGPAGSETKVIDTIVGTTITVTVNYASVKKDGWKVVNLTRVEETFGIILTGYFGYNPVSAASNYTDQFVLSGVYSTGSIGWGGYTTTATYPSTATQPITIEHLIFNNTGAFKTLDFSLPSSFSSFVGSTVTHVYRNPYGGTFLKATNALSWSFTDIEASNYPLALSLNTTLCSYTRVHAVSIGTVLEALALIGSKNTFTSCRFGGGGYCVSITNCFANTFTSCEFDNATLGALYYYGNSGNNRFVSCLFGQEIANTASIVGGSGYNQDVFINCLFDTAVVSSFTETVPGSFVKMDTYNQTTNDHRSWLKYGNIVSTGDGLSDTTVRTSGTGKFAIRFEPTSSTNTLDWEFDVPTGDIQTKTMTVAVWCKISNAAYYAGTHQNPRLTVDYDNGTTTYVAATDSTDWQLLSVSFVPTTTYGQITVTLSGRTDATTTNAYVYFDDFAILYPAGYKLDLGGMDLWADALPITPPIATVLSAADVWLVPTSTLTGTDTIGKYLVDNVGSVDAVAGFTADVVSGYAPLTVRFFDLSTGATSWSWNFGDTETSTEKDPVHVYAAAGTYTVVLSINSGADSETKTNFIVASTAPTLPLTGAGA